MSPGWNFEAEIRSSAKETLVSGIKGEMRGHNGVVVISIAGDSQQGSPTDLCLSLLAY